jgi:hypothetical protein
MRVVLAEARPEKARAEAACSPIISGQAEARIAIVNHCKYRTSACQA